MDVRPIQRRLREHHYRIIHTIEDMLRFQSGSDVMVRGVRPAMSGHTTLKFEATGFSLIFNKQSQHQDVYGRIRITTNGGGRPPVVRQVDFGPKNSIEELNRELRAFHENNGREYESVSDTVRYYGKLEVTMHFDNRPDLDVEVIEEVYKKDRSEVNREINQLKRDYQKLYQANIRKFTESSSVGSYKIEFNHSIKYVQNISEPSSIVQEPLPTAANPRNSKNRILYKLCEGKKLEI